jgi:hypothetical protein
VEARNWSGGKGRNFLIRSDERFGKQSEKQSAPDRGNHLEDPQENKPKRKRGQQADKPAPKQRDYSQLRLLGLSLAPGTIAAGFQRIEPLLTPLYEEIIARRRQSKYFHADRDFVRVGKGYPELQTWALAWLRRIRELYAINRERLRHAPDAPDSAEFADADAKLRHHIALMATGTSLLARRREANRQKMRHLSCLGTSRQHDSPRCKTRPQPRGQRYLLTDTGSTLHPHQTPSASTARQRCAMLATSSANVYDWIAASVCYVKVCVDEPHYDSLVSHWLAKIFGKNSESQRTQLPISRHNSILPVEVRFFRVFSVRRPKQILPLGNISLNSGLKSILPKVEAFFHFEDFFRSLQIALSRAPQGACHA